MPRKPLSSARLEQLREDVLEALRTAARPVSVNYLAGEIAAHHSEIRRVLEALATEGAIERTAGYRGSQAWSLCPSSDKPCPSSDGDSQSAQTVNTMGTAMDPDPALEVFYGISAAVRVADQIRERGGSVEHAETVLREIAAGRDVPHLRDYVARRIAGVSEEN